MFGGGFQMPQLSAAELRQAENDAYSVVNQGVVAAVSLYLSPFVIDAIWRMF